MERRANRAVRPLKIIAVNDAPVLGRSQSGLHQSIKRGPTGHSVKFFLTYHSSPSLEHYEANGPWSCWNTALQFEGSSYRTYCSWCYGSPQRDRTVSGTKFIGNVLMDRNVIVYSGQIRLLFLWNRLVN